MQKSEPPGGTSFIPASRAPAEFRRRALARLIDLMVALAPLVLVARGHRRAGELIAAAILMTADSLFGPGRSLGKRLFGLRTLMVATRRPAGLRASLRRNSVFALGLLPALAGAPLPVTIGALAAIVALEAGVALRPLTRDLGQRRLGDLLAGTQVVDASVALRLQQPLTAPAPSLAAPLASRAA